MNGYLNRVAEVLLKQTKARKLNDVEVLSLRLHRAQEELGETSRAFRDWCNHKDDVDPWPGYVKAFGRNSSPTIQPWKDHLVEETVDCVISSLALFAATAGTSEEFEEIFKRKMDKWEKNIDKAVD